MTDAAAQQYPNGDRGHELQSPSSKLEHIGLGFTPAQMELYPFGVDFLLTCSRNGEYTAARADQSSRDVLHPFIAYDFVCGAVEKLPKVLRGPRHTYLPSDRVKHFIRQVQGSQGAVLLESVPDRRTQARDDYLSRYADIAYRHKSGYPEIIGAKKLHDHLLAMKKRHAADGVMILRAAQGMSV